jgi:hypothetical protein
VIEQTPILFVYFSVVLLTYLIAVPISLLFEAPFLQIEKFFIFTDRREKDEKFEKLLDSSDTYQAINHSTFEETKEEIK